MTSKKYRRRNKTLNKTLRRIMSDQADTQIQIQLYLYRAGSGWFPDLQLSIEELNHLYLRRPVKLEIQTKDKENNFKIKIVKVYYIL